MPNYLLILRDSGDFGPDMSPAGIQAVLQKYGEWSDQHRASGTLTLGMKLAEKSGRVIQGKGSTVVTDGPFTEAREVVGGVFRIAAAGYDEAVEIALGCPHVQFGSIEIRELEIVR